MALPDNLRDFSDASTTRKWLMDDTLASLGKRFPIEDKDYRLELSNIRPEGPQAFGMTRQKNAIMRDEQLRIPIKAPVCAISAAGDTPASSGANLGTAELQPEAAQAIVAITDDADATVRKLNTCITLYNQVREALRSSK